MVGEKESWSSSNNKSGWSKQWTNISTSDSINNQNLQCKISSNPSLDVESQQPIFPCKAKPKPNALPLHLYVFWIEPHIFPYLNYFIFKCILDICLFSHIEFIVYSINSNNNVVDIVSRQQWYFQQYDIIVSCFFPFWDNNTHMNVSITVFHYLYHYHRLISIICSYYFLLFIIVLFLLSF